MTTIFKSMIFKNSMNKEFYTNLKWNLMNENELGPIRHTYKKKFWTTETLEPWCQKQFYAPSTSSSLLLGWDRLGTLECKLLALPTWIHRSDSGGWGTRDSTCLQWASSRGESSSSLSRQLMNSLTLRWRSSWAVEL